MLFSPITLRFLALASIFVPLRLVKAQHEDPRFSNEIAVDAAPMPSYLVFDPPSMKLTDYAVGGLVRVRLSAPPRSPTTLYYEAPSLSFTQCSVQFDQNNWNQWQDVRSVAMPYMTEADSLREFKMRFTASCPGNRLHGQVMDYAVTRGAGTGATCTSSGDPHYKSFDGKTFDFMGIGCYQLVRSGYLTIQTVTTQWGNTAASVNKAIAIRYGKAVWLIDAVTGKSCDDGGQDNSAVKLIESQNGRDFHFQFPEGTEVKVTIQDGTPKYLDVTVIAAGHMRGKTHGLCGTFDGNQGSDFTGPNDETFPDAHQFGEAWKCPERDNLFQCGSKCVGAKDYLLKPCTQCKAPTNLAGSGVVRDIPTGYRPTTTHQWPTYRPVEMPSSNIRLPPAPKCPERFLVDAREKCARVFRSLPEVSALVRTQNFIDNCIRDAKLTCSLAFLDGLKSTCMSEVRSITKTMAYDVESPSKVRASRSLSKRFGLGSEQCPQNCYNRGQCLTSGCKCRPGFSGMACEIDLGIAYEGARHLASVQQQFNNHSDPYDGENDFDQQQQQEGRPFSPNRQGGFNNNNNNQRFIDQNDDESYDGENNDDGQFDPYDGRRPHEEGNFNRRPITTMPITRQRFEPTSNNDW
jgi:hypothetical protein